MRLVDDTSHQVLVVVGIGYSAHFLRILNSVKKLGEDTGSRSRQGLFAESDGEGEGVDGVAHVFLSLGRVYDFQPLVNSPSPSTQRRIRCCAGGP